MADIPGGAKGSPEASREAAPLPSYSSGYSPTPSTRILGEESSTDSGFILVGEGQPPPGPRRPGAGKDLSILPKPSDFTEDIDLGNAFDYMLDDQNVASEHEGSEASDDDEENVEDVEEDVEEDVKEDVEEDSEATTSDSTASVEAVTHTKSGVGTSKGTSRGPSQSTKSSRGGRGRKPSYTTRSGHPRDALFSTASSIPPKKSLLRPAEQSKLISSMKKGLIMPESRDEFPPSALSLSAPQHEDRAIDHEKGMCIYWKMSKCGFKLPLSDFEMDLLRCLDVAPAQVASTSWCTIASFQSLFEEFKPLRGLGPTINLFQLLFPSFNQ